MLARLFYPLLRGRIMAEASESFSVTGMTCGGCAKSLEKALRRLSPDLGAVTIDHAAGRVTVAGSDHAALVAAAAEAAGFTFAGPAA